MKKFVPQTPIINSTQKGDIPTATSQLTTRVGDKKVTTTFYQ